MWSTTCHDSCTPADESAGSLPILGEGFWGSRPPPGQDRQAILEFQLQAGELQRSVSGATARAQEVLDQLAKIKETLNKSSPVGSDLLDSARALELKLTDAREMLTGDPTRSSRVVPMPLSIQRRARIAGGTLSNTYGPTTTQRRAYELAREQYEEVSQTLKELIEVELVQLQEKLDEAGIAWTPGRRIPQLNKQPRDNGDR